MRSVWRGSVTGFASATLALAMLIVNHAFEAVGSVPDVEGCGFLAGNLFCLAVLYPILAAIIASRAARTLIARWDEEQAAVARQGGRIGGAGSALYFGLGLGFLWVRGESASLPPTFWALLASYVLAASVGGRLGALSGLSRSRSLTLRESGG